MHQHFARRSAVLISLALSIVAVPAMAQSKVDNDDVRHMPVTFGDLDLTSHRDAVRLERRLARAAAEVCGLNDTSHPRVEAYRCYDRALADAHLALAQTKAQKDQRLVTR